MFWQKLRKFFPGVLFCIGFMIFVFVLVKQKHEYELNRKHELEKRFYHSELVAPGHVEFMYGNVDRSMKDFVLVQSKIIEKTSDGLGFVYIVESINKPGSKLVYRQPIVFGEMFPLGDVGDYVMGLGSLVSKQGEITLYPSFPKVD